MKTQQKEEVLVPITRAAGELSIGYFAARTLAFKGLLGLRWQGSRMYVTQASLQQLKAERVSKAGAREGR